MSETATTPAMILNCGGAADVGEIADLAARKLHKEGSAKLYCLAGIGAGLETFITTAKSASAMVAVDGCPVDCTKKTLEKYGIINFDSLRVTDLGFEKGKSPATDAAVGTIAARCQSLLNGAAS
jgi:uncharacterized metal-binding protein